MRVCCIDEWIFCTMERRQHGFIVGITVIHFVVSTRQTEMRNLSYPFLSNHPLPAPDFHRMCELKLLFTHHVTVPALLCELSSAFNCVAEVLWSSDALLRFSYKADGAKKRLHCRFWNGDL